MKLIALALAILTPLWLAPATAQDDVTSINLSARGDYEIALQVIESMAARGDVAAAYKLGQLFNVGEEINRNFLKAANYFALAAAQGFAPAQYSLGIKYEKGQGVPQSHGVAVMWYRRSAEQDHAEAQYRLGRMFAQGHGVERDYVAAIKWFDLAAAQGVEDAAVARQAVIAFLTPEQRAAVQGQVAGNPVTLPEVRSVQSPAAPLPLRSEPAQPELEPISTNTAQAPSYVNSVRGGAKAYNAGDFASALEIWSALAHAGNRSAQFHLGALYFEGSGISVDLSMAYYWLRIAAYQGDKRAPSLMAKAAAQLTGDEISAFDSQAREWLQSRSIEVSQL